jgi:hypothetical protein
MNIPACPLSAEPYEIRFDQELVHKFSKSFRSDSPSIPPTIGAIALQGAFQIINHTLKADWRKLLHVSQTFEYLKPIQLPMTLKTQTTLKEIKTRAQMHFLNFEISLSDNQTGEPIMTSKSTIIVRTS